MSLISLPEAAASYLALAASPTFAVMAVATALASGGPADALCGVGPQGWAPGGMAVMYLLMSAFHLSPWLRRRTR